jgi:prepilin-type N-terminal cleavage/methylation domain-containing protein
MRRKGFTLVELLVVIAIIALLMGILMPALAKVRQIAYRMMCGTNLSGIGKSISVYAENNYGSYPKSGGRRGMWGTTGEIANWEALTPTDAYGVTSGSVSEVTVTSCLYLLIKHGSVPAKQFVCKGDVGTKEFQASEISTTLNIENTDVWDFGPITTMEGPGFYCSYSYHQPFSFTAQDRPCGRPLSAESSSQSPLCADRNPYLDKNAAAYLDGIQPDEEAPNFDIPDGRSYGEYTDDDRTGNAAAHQREGQNILYNDGHVRFERYPNIGIANDNIWKYWPHEPPLTQEEKQLGGVGVGKDGNPSNLGADADWCQAMGTGRGSPTGVRAVFEDAYLVNEKNY